MMTIVTKGGAGLRAHMNRRRFLSALGGIPVWTLVAEAQQPAIPVIGFLSSASPPPFARLVAAFREGLQAQGFSEGHNVSIEFRWADGRYDALPNLADQLVRRPVSLIAATGGVVSANAAIGATSSIPIVFVVGFDPVQLGLVSSLNQPGGNATGVTIFTTELATKRLELLHQLLPAIPTVGSQTVAILVNPRSVATEIEVSASRAAAQQLGFKLVRFDAINEGDVEAAFVSAVGEKTSALLVSADPFFTSRRVQLVRLAEQHALPTMYPLSAYVDAGGLMSYGTELPWAYQQAGDYAGRILKGAKPNELPVMQPTTFNLVINLKTANALGITVPTMVLARANKVVE
jgi:putative ABC transport system substrate-binding protein